MNGPTRRTFLRSAGGAAAAPVAGASPQPGYQGFRQSDFRPAATPRKLSGNTYLYEDTCNVYIVRDGASCVLIDFGSGKVLDHLKDLGIAKVDWILHTHHHRDQCQGDWRAQQRGIPIAVPSHEEHLFSDVENFWRNRRVFHLYYTRNNFNTIAESVKVSRTLDDYTTLRWRNVEFRIMPTPGHTLGSITLLATIGGKRVAFSGDLIYAPGKILTLHDTQIDYGGAEGVNFGIYSLERLREEKPELLLPSHGEPMPDPGPAMAETSRRLTDYYKFQTGRNPAEENRSTTITPHLVAHSQTTSCFYTILSDSGKAMFIDYGSASSMHFRKFLDATETGQRIRFVEHNLNALKLDHGVTSIDLAVPSHMHDDHVNGFPHLARHYNTKIWCLENMKDIFEHPRGYNLGCILGEPFQVDRTFQPGERFRWEEYEFEITHSPGHTEYQMALFATIDGEKVAFSGDAFFTPREPGILRHNLIFRNHVENDSHLKSIHNLIDHEPTLIAPGHGKPFAVNRSLMENTLEKFRKQQQFFFDLLPEDETGYGLDPSWLSIYPYQILLAPGRETTIELRAQNYNAEPMKLEVALVAPAEWSIEPDTVAFIVPPKSKSSQRVTIRVPNNWTPPTPRFAIAADTMRNGNYIGQVTEAIVECA